MERVRGLGRDGGTVNRTVLRYYRALDATHVQPGAVAPRLDVLASTKSFSDFPGALEWSTRLRRAGAATNETAADTANQLSNLSILDTLVAVPSSDAVTVYHQLGSSAARTDYLPVSDPLGVGSSVSFGPALLRRGRPSDGAFPSFVLSTGNSTGLAVMIGWSGSWFANISRTADGVRLVVSTGRLSIVLKAGESVRSGRIVVLPYDAAGAGGCRTGYNLLRRFLRTHITPRDIATGKPAGYFLSGCGFPWAKNVTSQTRLIDMLKQAGADAFWLDAQWFTDGFPYGAGNWHLPLAETEGRVNFPEGIRALMDHARSPTPGHPGLSTILWNGRKRKHSVQS